MNYVDHLLKKLEVPKDMDKNFLMSLKRIELVEDCAGGAAATYAMLDFNSRLPIPWKTLSVSERCARKREWMKLHYVSHIEHMFMDMKNVAWGGHCFLHDESCHFRPKVCIMEEVQSIEDTFPGLEEATGHKTALDYMMHKFKTALPAYNAEIFRVQTSDWNIPQSRGRIYILLVRNNLASVEDLKMFHHLFDQFLPKNTPERKTTIKQVRDYVKSLLEAYGEEPVLPQPAQDGRRSAAAQLRERKAAKDLKLGKRNGPCIYSDDIPFQQKVLLNSRQKKVLDLTYASLLDDYIDPIAGGYIVDLARSYDRRTLSASQISALTSNVRLFDIAAKELLCGQDLLALQGYDISKLTHESISRFTYSEINRIAGEAMLAPVIGTLLGLALYGIVIPSKGGGRFNLSPVLRFRAGGFSNDPWNPHLPIAREVQLPFTFNKGLCGVFIWLPENQAGSNKFCEVCRLGFAVGKPVFVWRIRLGPIFDDSTLVTLHPECVSQRCTLFGKEADTLQYVNEFLDKWEPDIMHSKTHEALMLAKTDLEGVCCD